MKKMNSKFAIGGLLIIALGFGACATNKDPKIDKWGNTVDAPLGHNENAVLIPPPPPPANLPPLSPPNMQFGNQYEGPQTYLAGCTGDYFVADFHSGKILSSGRGYNAPEGVYALNSKGQKTGEVINATSGKSLFFRPDCGCKGNVSAAPMVHNHPSCPNN